jgi:hypothetical protein
MASPYRRAAHSSPAGEELVTALHDKNARSRQLARGALGSFATHTDAQAASLLHIV